MLPLNQSLTFEQATISEPLAIGVYSVERSPLSPSSNVAVLGVGPIGMTVFYALRSKSIGNVYVTDKIEERLTFSKKLNPAWSGNPDRSNIIGEISKHEPLLLDIVYECSGDPAAISQAVELLKPGELWLSWESPRLMKFHFRFTNCAGRNLRSLTSADSLTAHKKRST